MPKLIPRLASDIYRQHIERQQLQRDDRQLAVLKSFDHLNSQLQYLHVNQNWRDTILNFSCRLLSIENKKNKQNLHGIYLWGSVGIGKTFLMDCFFDSLVTPRKKRIHFHHFMEDVHAQLRQCSGQSDPLSIVAKNICSETDVLCLDEFFVSDIVDAMVLAGLLKALFNGGICFVTTSNIPPGQLYADGLQRESFLPAIAMLEKNTEVIHLMSDTDYRLHSLRSAGIYYTPLGASADQKMEHAFQLYAIADFSTEPLLVMDREIPVIKSCLGAAWFSFDILCGSMRCQRDYLALAQQFPLIFLSGVPLLSQRSIDEVTRFIQLVDIFYDAKIKLVISAEVFPHELYTEGKLTFEFQRITSRLIEMQSAEYYSSII